MRPPFRAFRAASAPASAQAVGARDVVNLAVPAFVALTAEPLLLVVDAAIVGQLGTGPLAALGVASVVLQTSVGLCVFLAFATTPRIARLIGAQRWEAVARQSVNALWLSAIVGLALAAGLAVSAGPLAQEMVQDPEIAADAATYLQISCLGVPAMLLVLAATGVLRGFSDATTPLRVLAVSAALNAVANYLLVHPWGWGLPGSAVGTVAAQWVAAIWLVVACGRRLPGSPRAWAPDVGGIVRSAQAGVPIVVRTVLLRACLFLTALAAARLGGLEVATHQVAITLWTLLAYALDSLAIAAQTLVGRQLGASDTVGSRQLVALLQRWALTFGFLTGVLLAAASPYLGFLFTDDPLVREQLTQILLIAALLQPLAALVFLFDGVLLGAGDNTYLAVAGLLPLAILLPGLAWADSLAQVWLVFGCGFVGGRLLPLWWRTRGNAWMVTGA